MFYENLSEIVPFNDYNLHDADWHNVLKPLFELFEPLKRESSAENSTLMYVYMITIIRYILYTV